MKKILFYVIFCTISCVNILQAQENATIYIGWPATAKKAAMAGGSAVKQYCEMNSEYIGAVHMREYLAVHVNPGTYTFTLYASVNKAGWGGWDYRTAKSKNISKTYSSISVEAGQTIFISVESFSIMHESEWQAHISSSMLINKVLDVDKREPSQNTQTKTADLQKDISKSSVNHINPNSHSDVGMAYIAMSSDKKSYYNYKVYYEIDGIFIATTAVQEFFKVELPVGVHTICAYMNPKKVKKDYTIDAKTEYYNNLEEIKQKSIYQPDCQKISILPGDNYFTYTGNMVVLSKVEFQERLNKCLIARESKAVVPSLVSGQQQTNQSPISPTTPNVKQTANNSVVDNNIPIMSSHNDNTYVLIIANENYESLSPVTYAAKDGQIFKQYCIQTLGIPEKQIRFCSDASYGNMVGSVDWLTYALNNFQNAKAIVYYCGHGIPDEKTGHAYLIPVDGKGTNMSTCYSLNKLYKTLAATKAQSITYFMDACFTGANKEGSMLVAARGVARAPEKETLSGKTIVFSASSGDETAMTLDEQGHGLFTYYLLKKLQDSKGDVTYGELADYINQNVKKDAFLINEKPQTPVVATSPAVVNTWKTMKLK